MVRRAAAIVVSLASLAAFAAPAMAAPSPAASALCEGRTGRDAGRCSGDAIKQWARLQREFEVNLESKHKKWHDENGNKGISAEATLAHAAYHKEMQKLRDEFKKKQKAEQSLFHQERKVVRQTPAPASTTVRPRALQGRMEEGMKICAKQKSEEEHRICMKPYLRPAPKMGATKGLVQ